MERLLLGREALDPPLSPPLAQAPLLSGWLGQSQKAQIRSPWRTRPSRQEAGPEPLTNMHIQNFHIPVRFMVYVGCIRSDVLLPCEKAINNTNDEEAF